MNGVPNDRRLKIGTKKSYYNYFLPGKCRLCVDMYENEEDGGNKCNDRLSTMTASCEEVCQYLFKDIDSSTFHIESHKISGCSEFITIDFEAPEYAIYKGHPFTNPPAIINKEFNSRGFKVTSMAVKPRRYHIKLCIIKIDMPIDTDDFDTALLYKICKRCWSSVNIDTIQCEYNINDLKTAAIKFSCDRNRQYHCYNGKLHQPICCARIKYCFPGDRAYTVVSVTCV